MTFQRRHGCRAPMLPPGRKLRETKLKFLSFSSFEAERNRFERGEACAMCTHDLSSRWMPSRIVEWFIALCRYFGKYQTPFWTFSAEAMNAKNENLHRESLVDSIKSIESAEWVNTLVWCARIKREQSNGNPAGLALILDLNYRRWRRRRAMHFINLTGTRRATRKKNHRRKKMREWKCAHSILCARVWANMSDVYTWRLVVHDYFAL